MMIGRGSSGNLGSSGFEVKNMIRPIIIAAMTLLGTGGLAGATSANDTTLVNVRLADFSFKPNALSFEKGQHYRLHLSNEGSGGHNFSGAKFFAAVRIDAADPAPVQKGQGDGTKGADAEIGV